ncbi:hypothetical protein [Actinophytocola algeriensis]|uniref:Uncharacterized protein n=1 Tax=Actinophytocola algeriensis TaxID=1768010 RepID=A0A7W7QBG2_9PSEU|nr:hypothetical protein [Actinophytocola algeriensis]MBB4910547.1 hypothetical protein [Actinophytocola algeriensis]MBE1480464.1 hypothetical protein [Actinophytocola algeriensis]
MSHKPQATAGAASEVEELVRRLDEVRSAITRARDLGVPAAVPEPLYRACLALVETHGGPRGGGMPLSGSYAQATRVRHAGEVDIADSLGLPSPADDLIGKVPLRQVLWEVITPGERFTVADVTERLEQRGVSWPSNKISNALGYWVSRRRLDRCKKGVYLYPENPVADDHLSDVAQQESPAGLASRAAKSVGGEENNSHVPSVETRQAM